MKVIFSNIYDPYFNLAFEETLLLNEQLDEDILFFYQNENAVIIGRNQNSWEEINQKFVEENNVKVVRRISGGGSVYHDMGNFNFSFISKNRKSYNKFLEPMLNFFDSIGLSAKLEGKNDIKVDEFKISGNAQYACSNGMLHHGTILFDSNLSTLSKAIKSNKIKLESKGIQSNRQRVANIKDLLKYDLSREEFKNQLISFFKQGDRVFSTNDFDDYPLEDIKRKYISNEWTYGKNPYFSFQNIKRFNGGTIKLKLLIDKNKIKKIVFEGDFLSRNDFEKIYDSFVDINFDKKILEEIIFNIQNFEDFFGKIKKSEVLSLFTNF